MTGQMNHTPGPWKAVPGGKHWNNQDLVNIEIQYGEDGECIADTVYEMADAALIAASPDLLRELKHLVRALEPLERDGIMNAPGVATLNGARAAINKAEPR